MKKVTCDCCGEPIIEPPVEEFEHEIELQTVKGGTLWSQISFEIIRSRPVMEGDQPWDAASFDICTACHVAAIQRACGAIAKLQPCEWPAALVCLGPYRHEANPKVEQLSADQRCGAMSLNGHRCSMYALHDGHHSAMDDDFHTVETWTQENNPCQTAGKPA